MNFSKVLMAGMLSWFCVVYSVFAYGESKDTPYLSGMPNYALTGGS